jgi:hypothetical protein
MAAFDVKKIGNELISVAKVKLGEHYEEAKPFADLAFKQLAENIALITELRLTNVIDDQKAKLHLELHKSAVKINLLAIEGIGIIAVEDIINSALDIVKDVVNTAIGFAII